MKTNQLESDRKGQRGVWNSLKWGLVPLVMAVAWTGCQQSAKVDTGTNPAGTYTLVSVDGNQVPCAVNHEGHALNVKSGTFIINPEGTCSSKVAFSVPGGGENSREVKATYTREGQKLTMHWEGAGMNTGTVNGDTFTMNNEGMIFAYRK